MHFITAMHLIRNLQPVQYSRLYAVLYKHKADLEQTLPLLLMKTSSYINPDFASALPCLWHNVYQVRSQSNSWQETELLLPIITHVVMQSSDYSPSHTHTHTHHSSPFHAYSTWKSITEKPTVLQYYISVLVSVSLSTLAYFWGGLLDVLIMMLSLRNKSVSP